MNKEILKDNILVLLKLLDDKYTSCSRIPIRCSSGMTGTTVNIVKYKNKYDCSLYINNYCYRYHHISRIEQKNFY